MKKRNVTRNITALLLCFVLTGGVAFSGCSNKSAQENGEKPSVNRPDLDIIGIDGKDHIGSGSVAESTDGYASPDKAVSESDYEKLVSAYRKEVEAQQMSVLGIDPNDYVWTIVSLKSDNLIDRYSSSNSKLSFSQYATAAGQTYKTSILREQTLKKQEMRAIDSNIEFSYSYTVVDNGFAAKVKYGDIDKIRKLGGVKSVRISEEYGVPDGKESTLYSTAASSSATYAAGNHYLAEEDEYMGEGVFIAVLDTALDIKHPAFSGDCIDMTKAAVDKDYIEKLIPHTIASNWNQFGSTASEDLSSENAYVNNKLVYQFDYGNRDYRVSPVLPELTAHGTHTAGITVGYDSAEYEGSFADEYGEFRGVAPKAQLAFMKVFYENTIDYTVISRDTYVAAAIEDSIVLGVDAINISLGAPRGFSVDNSAESYIYSWCAYADSLGISVQAAVGNNFSGAFSGVHGDFPLSSIPDYGSVNSPASYASTLAVGSYGGTNVANTYAIAGAGTTNECKVYIHEKTAYTDPASSSFGKRMVPDDLAEGTYQWVLVPGNGSYQDFVSAEVAGKIVLVRKNDKITKRDQMVNAMRLGAKAVIFVDETYLATRTVSSDVNSALPYCAMSLIDAETMTKNWTVTAGTIAFNASYLAYNLMSEFSSWGVTNTLNIKPEIVAVGGNVYSTLVSKNLYSETDVKYFDHDYTVMSGTSMAAPVVTGYMARLRQIYSKRYPELNDVELAKLVNAVIMSTATQLTDLNGTLYSPRYQGAGAVNYTAAKNAQSYLSVVGQTKPKIELGEDAKRTGVYILKFEINNLASSAKSYDISLDTMTDSLCADNKTVSLIAHMFEGCNMKVTVGKGASLAGKTVTVPANGKASVAVELKLTNEQKAYLNDNFAYGSYVEGFVHVTENGGDDLSLPYLAFYGDWEESPMLDSTIFDDEEAYLYPTRLWGTYYLGRFSIALGEYPYTVPEGYDPISYDADRLAIGSQTGGYYSLTSIYLGLLRNADTITFNIFDKYTGESYSSHIAEQIGKAGYVESYATMYPVVQDLTFGRELTNNAVFTLSITANKKDLGTTINAKDSISFDIVVDSEAPRLYNDSLGVYAKEDGSIWISINVYDNHNLSSVGLYTLDENGKSFLLDAPFPVDIKNEWVMGQKNTLEYEITKYVGQFSMNTVGVVLEDAAMNEASYRLAMHVNLVPEEDPEPVPAAELVCEETINIARGYSSDLGVAVKPFNATYTLSVDETYNNTGEVYIDHARQLVAAREAGVVRIKIESGSIVKYCLVNVYIINGEWVFSLIVDNGNGVRYFDEEKEALDIDQTVAYDNDKNVDKQRYYKVHAYMGDGTHVIIPSEYDGCPVIDIGANSFIGCANLRSVFVPKEIRHAWWYSFGQCPKLTDFIVEEGSQLLNIGAFMFEYCESLQEFTVPASVVNIESNAFAHCTSFKNLIFEEGSELREIQYSAFYDTVLEAVTLPDKVKSIGSAFAGTRIKKMIMPESLDAGGANFDRCEYLEEVQISSTSTGSGSYNYCTALKSIVIPEGVKGISGFRGCTSLTHIELPDSVTSIGVYVFQDCTRLVSVKIGSGVTSIGNQAFVGCVSLRSVYFGQDMNVTTWGTDVFLGCVNLVEFTVHPLNKNYMSDDGILYRKSTGSQDNWQLFNVPMAKRVEVLIVRPDVDTIADFAFLSHSELKTVLIPQGAALTKIGNYAFAGCTSLSLINLENATNLNTLGQYAFASCTDLTSVALPDSLQTIPAYAFYLCLYLEKCTFGNRLSSIQAHAFEYCIRFEGTDGEGTLVLPASLTLVGEQAFIHCKALKKIDMSACLGVNLSGYAFADCSYVKEVVLPTNTTVINQYVFAYCTALSKINLAQTQVAEIKNDAFYGCDALEEIEFPESINQIGREAFAFSGLRKLDFPELGVNGSIGQYAFAVCSQLTEINLPNDLKTLEPYVFSETAITEIKIPNSVGRFDLNEVSFRLCYNLERFIVDEDNPYFGTTDEGILYIKAFHDILNDVDVANTLWIVPLNLQAKVLDLTDKYAEKESDKFDIIYDAMFAFNTGIEKLIIPSTITTIMPQAFAYSSLQEVVFAEDSFIDFKPYNHYSIFRGCAQLEKVTLPAHISNIPALTFYGCTALKEVNIPESVTLIAESAFAGCESLETIDLSHVEEIEAQAFAFCSSLKEVTFGRYLTTISQALNGTIFEGCSSLERIDVHSGNKVFKSIDGVLFDKAGTILYVYPAAKAGSEYSVPYGVSKIGEMAFGYNRNLKKVILPETMTSIGTFAFYLTEQLDTYVFLSKNAPVLESQFLSPTVGVVYANFYNFSQLEFEYPIYMEYPEDGEGYDLWIYQIFFYSWSTIKDESKYSSPDQSEIPVVTGPEITDPTVRFEDYTEAFADYLDELKRGRSASVVAALDELYRQFEEEHETYYDFIYGESEFGRAFLAGYEQEAERIVKNSSSFFAVAWDKIHTLMSRVETLKASGNYSETYQKALDSAGYFAKLHILEALEDYDLDAMDEYFVYYNEVISTVPTTDKEAAFTAKLEALQSQMNALYEAIDSSLYSEEVYEKIEEAYLTNEVTFATSEREATKMLNDFTTFVDEIYKEAEYEAFLAYIDEQLARLDAYKMEDYDYYSERDNGNMWALMERYIRVYVKPALEECYLRSEVDKVIDEAVELFDLQATKYDVEKQDVLALLNTLIKEYNMYFNLYDEQAKQLRLIVAEVTEAITAAKTTEEMQTAFDEGFDSIWEFYEYNQKPYVEYRRALAAFETLTGEEKEQAMRELRTLSYRVSGNAEKIAALIEKYMGARTNAR